MGEATEFTLRAPAGTTNTRGEWVPAIPLPHVGFRDKCHCGRKFWTRAGYRAHYALVHILGLKED
jgi:hypothetical protein